MEAACALVMSRVFVSRLCVGFCTCVHMIRVRPAHHVPYIQSRTRSKKSPVRGLAWQSAAAKGHMDPSAAKRWAGLLQLTFTTPPRPFRRHCHRTCNCKHYRASSKLSPRKPSPLRYCQVTLSEASDAPATMPFFDKVKATFTSAVSERKGALGQCRYLCLRWAGSAHWVAGLSQAPKGVGRV